MPSLSEGLSNVVRKQERGSAARAWLTCGKGQLGKAWPWRVNLIARTRLADHVTGHQMAVQDVPRGGDEAAAVTDPVERVRVDLEVALAVGFCGEGWETDKTDKWTLTCGRTGEQTTILISEEIMQMSTLGSLAWVAALTAVGAHVDLEWTGTGAALVALWEGAYALVGVGLLGFVLRRGRGCRWLLLTAGAVVHEVRLQIPLAAIPDPAVFARENVLWQDTRHERKERYRRKWTHKKLKISKTKEWVSITCYFNTFAGYIIYYIYAQTHL